MSEEFESVDAPEVAEDASAESEGLEASAEASNESELEDQIAEAQANGASKKEIQKMIERFELKVNGKNVVREIDLNDKEAIKRELQLALAGRQTMQEMAELKKLYNQEIDRLRQDPFAVLKELGIDPDELSYSHLERKVQEAQKSPEEQERDRLQKELEELRGKAKQEEERRIQAEQSRLQEQAAKQLDDEIDDALDEYKHLPRSPRVVKHIASVMMWALDNGMEDITVKDVLPTVEKELKKEISDIIDNLPEEFIEEFIGQRGIERLRKKRVAQAAQQPKSVAGIKPAAKAKPAESKPSARRSLEDFLRG
jgi:hypothetical protein